MSASKVMLLITAIIVVVVAVNFWQKQAKPKDVQSDHTATETKGQFTMTADYITNSKWNYVITAQLPTPCDSATVEASVAESSPEQVQIRVTPTKIGEVCIQTLNNFRFEGTFSASERATLSLSIIE